MHVPQVASRGSFISSRGDYLRASAFVELLGRFEAWMRVGRKAQPVSDLGPALGVSRMKCRSGLSAICDKQIINRARRSCTFA